MATLKFKKINQVVWRSFFVLMLFYTLPLKQAFAANNEEQRLEEYLDGVISRSVDKSKFSLSVKVSKSKQQVPTLPYMPENVEISTTSEHPREIVKNLQDIKIEIAISDVELESLRKPITDLINASLNLSNWPQAISFTPIKSVPADIATTNSTADDSKIMSSVANLEAALREEKRLSQNLLEEKNQVTQKLSLVERDLEKLERLPKEEQAAEGGKNKSSDNIQKTDQNTLYTYAALALSALIGLIVLGLLVSRGAKSLGQLIQAGIEKLASNIGTLSFKSTGDSSNYKNQDILDQKRGSHGESQKPQMSLAESQQRIKTLHHELLEKMNNSLEVTTNVVISYVIHLASEAKNIEKIVCSLELFGSDHANRMYQKLNSNLQSSIRQFLQTGVYSTSKTEVMLDAAEAINTQILCAGMKHPLKKLTPKLEGKMIQVSDNEICKIAPNLPGELLPRYFCYLDEKEIAKIIANFKNENEEYFKRSVEALKLIHKMDGDTSLDDELFNTIDQWQKSAASNSQLAYLPLYQKVLEAMDENISEEVLGKISEDSLEAKEYLESRIVTFATFFKLQVEVQEQVLSLMSMKEIIPLLIFLDDKSKNIIRTLLDAQQLAIIDDEMKNINQQSTRRWQQQFNDAKAKIKAIIKGMAEQQDSLLHLIEERSTNQSTDQSQWFQRQDKGEAA